MCNEGPEEMLNETVNSHVAIVVTSLANVERLKETRPNSVRDCLGVAGFGIGEITSLIFAGAFQFDQGDFLSARNISSSEILKLLKAPFLKNRFTSCANTGRSTSSS